MNAGDNMKLKTIPFTLKQDIGNRYIQLYHAISQDILQGKMKKGDQLPSIRSAAKQLNLSRTTIENAYQRLLMEGLIVAHPQRGYFVDADETQSELRQEIMNTNVVNKNEEAMIDLRTSSIDSSAFDTTIWLHYIKLVLQNHHWLTSYGDSQGEYLLRKAIQKYSYAMRGVLSKENQIVIGANFQSLLYVICSLYDGKKIIGMEKTGFKQAEQVFLDYGFTIIYLEHDEEGILIDDLEKYDLGMLYINSASCGTKKKPLHSKRRKELLDYAYEQHVLILEDDHNGELRYQTKLRPAMQGFDTRQQIIYMRSFSKLLLPSIRMSFMVLNEPLIQRYEQKKQNYHPSASKLEQLALAHYLIDGHMEKQIRQLRKRYEDKSNFMISLLKTYLKDFAYLLDESNLQVLLYPKKTDKISCYIETAKKHRILIQEAQDHALALSFASVSKETLKEALSVLANVWKQI